MREKPNGVIRVLLAAAALASCSSTEPKTLQPQEVPAVLAMGQEQAQLSVPDTVAAHTPFTVQFTSFAGGCTRSVARMEIDYGDGAATLRGYDLHVSSAVCS